MQVVPSGADHPSEYGAVAGFFDGVARSGRPAPHSRAYRRLIEQISRFQIPAGARVLEVGCGSGDLLAALQPSVGLGVDVSSGMLALARERHPHLQFAKTAGEDIDLGQDFDYVVLSDLVPFVHDLLALFRQVARHCHPGTRVIVHSYSRAWRPILRAAELVGVRAAEPIRNWVSPQDVENFLELAGLQVVTVRRRVLLPVQSSAFSILVNGFLGSLWPFNHLCLTYWVVARPRPAESEDMSVSVVCPCRNEAGNIGEIVRRLPAMGTETELVFVEGGSTDDTYEEIGRQIAAHPEREMSVVRQPGTGKGDAVRAGFGAARHDLLTILDGDLSVPAEDLPSFYAAAAGRRGEMINGSRLVYDREPGAMRFVNTVGNRIFARFLSAITGQRMTDTLCGTKAVRRADYAMIAENRPFFGEFDPFGDFDLLLGAARLNHKIAEVPVRYQPRTYGRTNISRWRHGWLLVQMLVFAFWKFRIDLYRQAREPAEQASRGIRGLATFLAIGLAYVLLRIWSFANVFDNTPPVYPDTIIYERVQSLAVWTSDFWAGHALKPAGAPLLWKLLPGSTAHSAPTGQFVLSVIAWLVLASVVARLLTTRALRLIGFALVLALSTTPMIGQWDGALLSESLSVSLAALMVASLLVFVQRPTAWRLAAVLAITLYSALTRDQNAVLALLVLIPIGIGLAFARPRRWALAVAVGGVLVFAASYATINSRGSEITLGETIATNILPDPQATRYFVDRGMPLSPDLANLILYNRFPPSHYYKVPQLAAFRRWESDRGATTYARYLLTHPDVSLGEPLRNLDLILAPSRALPLGLDYFRPVGFRDALPSGVEDILYPSQGWLLLAWLVIVAIVALYVAVAGLAHRVWIVPAVLVASTIPNGLFVWDVDSLGHDRHELIVDVLARLGMWILALFVADACLARYRLSRQQRAPRDTRQLSTSPEHRPA